MKNTIIRQIGEFFCPYYCLNCGKVGGILCKCCEKYIILGPEMGCLKCGKKLEDGRCTSCTLPFDRQYCLGWRENDLKDLVSLLKYQHVRACGVEMARLLACKYGKFTRDALLVPLPTIRKHVRERGFDHTLKLAH